MSITRGTGNLLTQDVDALVNTVNTQGIMGKGIALQCLAGTCGLLVDSCGLLELPRGDADETLDSDDRTGSGPRSRWPGSELGVARNVSESCLFAPTP